MDGIASFPRFVADHKNQLDAIGIPEHFWHMLCKKLRDQIFDSGTSFQLVKVDYGEAEQMPYDPTWSVVAIKDIDKTDSGHIYLLDHTWTFYLNTMRRQLLNLPDLLTRLCNLLDISQGTTDEKIKLVLQKIWPYTSSYVLRNGEAELSDEERVPNWYILDELGSAVTHSDNPNFILVPFMYVPEQMMYSIMFPIENVEEGSLITRDFVPEHSDPQQREAMLIPWKHYYNFFDQVCQSEPSIDYFLEGHVLESLPNLENLQEINTDRTKKLKVFSEYKLINEYLKSPDFEIVDNELDADILWFTSHFKDYNNLSHNHPKSYVNQFPFEYVITIKDLLPVIARRICKGKKMQDLETLPSWLPTTFNMRTELANFVAYYMQRKNAGLDNNWICKPFNLARGLDIHITDNLYFLCRLPASGPKIAQKYIENPVLFHRPDIGLVKFDIRYVILLKSVNPTEVYVYNNFFLRFANKQFVLDNFDDYEQHFTVMNYHAGINLHRMLCEEFKAAWSDQYSSFEWKEVEQSILNMFSELFVGATAKDAPLGIGKSPQSRALYAADLMLSWNNDKTKIQPKLLEVNWMPDCRRACEYYPEFYNDIFSLLFLDKKVNTCTKVL